MSEPDRPPAPDCQPDARSDCQSDARPDAQIDVQIDARGLLCPLPVLRLRKRLASMAEGQVVSLIATDPASWIDVPHFCAVAGHELLSADDRGGERTYLVRRGSVAPA